MSALSRWFFERGDPRTPAALRVAVCCWYLAVLWDFYPAMPLIFGHAGLFGTLERFPYHLTGLQYLLYRFNSPAQLEFWFWSSVVVSACAAVGLFTRSTFALMFCSMILFRERGPFITFGADLVMNCIGFWMLFVAWGRGPVASRKVEFWPVKAIQIQVALIYLVTGLKKLQTEPWRDGSAVYYAIQVGSVLKGHPPSWFMAHHNFLLFMNYGTLTIEMALPFLLFYRPARFWAMAAGVAMHTGIDVLMSIRFFSLAMYVGYLSFLDTRDWEWLATAYATARAKITARFAS